MEDPGAPLQREAQRRGRGSEGNLVRRTEVHLQARSRVEGQRIGHKGHLADSVGLTSNVSRHARGRSPSLAQASSLPNAAI
eukprot:364268-Chlamydomonas_euryale.AAC.20